MELSFIKFDKYINISDIVLIYHNEYYNSDNESYYKYFTDLKKIINILNYNTTTINNINNDIGKILKLSNNKNNKINKINILLETSYIIQSNIEELLLLALQNINLNYNLIIRNYNNYFELNYTNIINIPNCIKIFSTSINKDIKNSNIINIPLGISDSRYKYGKEKFYNYIINKNMKKNKYIFFNFNIKTNKIQRQLCYDICTKKNIKFIKRIKNELNYLKILNEHKYTICPVGFGIDCFRIWEALYFRIIPICLKEPCFINLSKQFPIMIIDKWEDLNTDVEYLDNYYSNINWDDYKDILSFNYWKNIICN